MCTLTGPRNGYGRSNFLSGALCCKHHRAWQRAALLPRKAAQATYKTCGREMRGRLRFRRRPRRLAPPHHPGALAPTHRVAARLHTFCGGGRTRGYARAGLGGAHVSQEDAAQRPSPQYGAAAGTDGTRWWCAPPACGPWGMFSTTTVPCDSDAARLL